LVYILSGQGQFGATGVSAAANQRMTLGPGETLKVSAIAGADEANGGRDPLRFILIAGRPIFRSRG